MKKYLYLLLSISLALLISACQNSKAQAIEDSKWENLLEGDSLNEKWRSPNKDKEGNYSPVGRAWSLEDGKLRLDFSKKGTLKDGKKLRGGHIETKKDYFNFELKFEFNIKYNNNSGIKYRVKNATGFEYQIIDDANYRDNSVSHRTGELYELVEEETPRIVKSAGDWNTGRIIANGNTIEHWLNGQKVFTLEYGSEDWKARFEDSKYFKKEILDFGTHLGPIHIQDHSDTDIEFKNMFIRELGVK